MYKDENILINHISAGGKITANDEISPAYRGELMRLMVVFTDSELAGAAGFVPFINSAPGLRERTVAAQIVTEKFSHAEAVLGLLERFGVHAELYVRSHAWDARLDRDIDLGNRRIAGDKRLNIFHYPLEGWVDAVTMNMLMGTASSVQLNELLNCSYEPLATVMGDIVKREESHATLGETGLREALERGSSKLVAQATINYWYPRVAATFGRADSERGDVYQKYGLRHNSNADLLKIWEEKVSPKISALGLSLPASGA